MEWISVNYRLPQKDKDVLLLIQKFKSRNPYERIGWIDSETNEWFMYCELGEIEFSKSSARNVDYYDITHWMPLPEPHKQLTQDNHD